MSESVGKNKKIFLFGIIITIIVIVLLSLPPVLFLGKPQTFPREQISIQEIMLMGQVMQKFRKATAKDEQGKLPPLTVIVLNPAEINMLIRSSMHFLPAYKDTEWTAYWDRQEGFLVVHISRKLAFAALNISFFIVPEYRNRQLDLQCKFCKIGSIALPPQWANPFLKKITADLSKRNEYKTIQNILTEAVILKPASLKMTFRPDSISGQLPFLN